LAVIVAAGIERFSLDNEKKKPRPQLSTKRFHLKTF